MVDDPEDARSPKYATIIVNSTIDTLVIGDGNIVNHSCRGLHYAEPLAPESGGKTAIQDGGQLRQMRGVKRQKQSKIRFPQRKFRPKSKSVLSESEEGVDVLVKPEIFLNVLHEDERKIERCLSKFFTILNKLHPLRDSGSAEQFNITAERLLIENQGDPRAEILIRLERSVIACYHNNIEHAEGIVSEILRILEKSTVIDAASYHFLVAMAHCHLTGFYRRQNKHGKAEDSIGIADQYSNSRFLKALIYYEMASNLTKFISSIPNCPAREEYVARARNWMKQCISLCTELDDGTVYIRKHIFGLIKLALMDLNCRTSVARRQSPSLKCIEDAKNCIETVEKKYGAVISEGQKIQLLVAKSDLSFRLQNFQDAEENCRLALDLTKRTGFELEIKGIIERQDDFKLLGESVTVEIPSSREHLAESLSSSTSPSRKNSPHSSCTEMDVV